MYSFRGIRPWDVNDWSIANDGYHCTLRPTSVCTIFPFRLQDLQPPQSFRRQLTTLQDILSRFFSFVIDNFIPGRPQAQNFSKHRDKNANPAFGCLTENNLGFVLISEHLIEYLLYRWKVALSESVAIGICLTDGNLYINPSLLRFMKLVQVQQTAYLHKIPTKFPDWKERVIQAIISVFPYTRPTYWEPSSLILIAPQQSVLRYTAFPIWYISSRL